MAKLGVPNNNHRRAVALHGSPAWARQQVELALAECPLEGGLWVGADAPDAFECIAPQRFREHLGSEHNVLVYDAHRDFHPDCFAALLGTLRAGGVLYLLLPGGEDWPDSSDPALARLAPWPMGAEAVGRRFFRRLQEHITKAQAFISVRQDRPEPLPIPTLTGAPSWTLTREQIGVVDAIVRVAMGHARRPLVLTADRGRGKSTAIGAALARLLPEGKRVVLCAPSVTSVQAVFAQLRRELPAGVQTEQDFSWGEGGVHYRSPSLQLEQPLACDLLVVDEAAAVGLAALAQLVTSHNRLVFSTTVHGYEGSGRGFVLRFGRLLREVMPGTRQYGLQAPVRWRAGDPLEEWLNAAFLLDAEPGVASESAGLRYDWVDQGYLAGNEALLAQVFGLLVAAHYQTRPSDLQQLLDAPGLRLLLAIDGGVVVGVLLGVIEGGFDSDLAARICSGERRPRGHLLLQSLAQHAGWCEAPTLRALRVMRIAVQEGRRRRGIGAALLMEAERYARDADLDLLGTSFGLDASLLPFWLRAGYRVVRIGQRVDPASGAHSAQLLRGLTSAGEGLTQAAQAGFRRDLPWRLQQEFGGLSADLILQLLSGAPFSGLIPDERDLENVHAFARGGRGYLEVYPSLWRWLLAHVSDVAESAGPDLLRQILQESPSASLDRGKERELRARVATCLAQAEAVDRSRCPT